MPLPTRGLVRGHRSARVDRRTSVALCRGRMRSVASARQFTFKGVHGPPLVKARSPRSYTVSAESGATHATVAVAATILLPVVKHFSSNFSYRSFSPCARTADTPGILVAHFPAAAPHPPQNTFSPCPDPLGKEFFRKRKFPPAQPPRQNHKGNKSRG